MTCVSPLPRIGALALHDAARAAGYALACPYETSAQAHAEAVSAWRRRNLAPAWRLLPSRLSILIATVLVIL